MPNPGRVRKLPETKAEMLGKISAHPYHRLSPKGIEQEREGKSQQGALEGLSQDLGRDRGSLLLQTAWLHLGTSSPQFG